MDGLAVIGDLSKLEILRLGCFGIEKLPVEVGHLTRLKLLDLRGCWNLAVIPPNIISGLSHLEELYLGRFNKWEMEGINNEERKASLAELHHLPYLTSLQIRVKDVSILPKDLCFFKKLERYDIFIGDRDDYLRRGWPEISRKFYFRDGNDHICIDIKDILQLKRIEDLDFDGWMVNKNIFFGSDNEDISQLKYLQVKNNPNLFCIVEYSNNNDGAVIEFRQLRQLTLSSLPQLTSFCSKLKVQPNEIINLGDGIDVPTTLFNVKVAFPNLDYLVLYKINVERIWQNRVVALSCGIQSLTSLRIHCCSNLRCLFSSSIARSLNRLKYLHICECPLLEEIVFLDDGLREEEMKNAMFLQLESLTITGLENLSKFYSGEDHIVFPSLKTLRIVKCPKWKEFMVKNARTNLTENPTSFFNEKVAFPNLEDIVISAMDNLKMIVHPQLAHQVLFRKLKSMRVQNCDNLKCLTLCGVDSQLKSLDILGCGLEEIDFVGNEGAEQKIVLVGNEGAEQTNTTIVLPSVISLSLGDMPNFTTLFSGEQLIYKVFPNLKKLSVQGRGMETMIRHFSQKLKILHIELDKATDFSSLDFVQRFLNMEVFVITGGFSSQEVDSIIDKNGMLKVVVYGLDSCSDLKHILKEESNMNHLVHLKVNVCCHLINLVPSSTSFQNLTSLEVFLCYRLKNIVTASTAKSLVRLRKMIIGACSQIIEIVVNEGDDDRIVFKELKELTLINLRSVTSFCSGNYTFEFPALGELIVAHCPNMMIFSGGELSTPNLHKVKLYQEDEVGHWKGELNTTIQQLHEEGKVRSSKEESGQPSTQHLG